MDITDTDLRQIISLFEMSERGSQEGVEDHVKNEAANAVSALFRLLGKYGLSIGDVPELQRQHAAKAAAAAGSPTATEAAGGSADPNILELTHHLLRGYIERVQ
jgi:hypothetical protein